MAFLCPVRIRRNKKRKGASGYASDGEEKVTKPPGIGRITGSASIETLVRVGLEKEAGLSPDSKMVVLQDFLPCVDDELEVKRGNIVNVLYQENDWMYVIANNGKREGFIPQSYCAPYNSQLAEITLNQQKKKLPRNSMDMVGAVDTDHNTTIGTINSDTAPIVHATNDSYMSNNNMPSDTSQQSDSTTPDVHPFFKNNAGRYIVLYTFVGRDENDVSVERGEFVTVLNRDDPEWFWVVRSDGLEGFVPSAFVYPADVIQEHLQSGRTLTSPNQNVVLSSNEKTSKQQQNTQQNQNIQQNTQQQQNNSDDSRAQGGTELVMLYDYKAQASDDLTVRRGEWIYADLSDQTVDGWLWAFSPKARKYGFVPKAYARIPAMTSL